MGIFIWIYNWIYNWIYKGGLKGIRKQIQKVIKKKRLIFLGDNNVMYIDKKGKRMNFNFERFADVAIEAGGWSESMVKFGITNQDVVNILTEEYAKHKKEVK